MFKYNDMGQVTIWNQKDMKNILNCDHEKMINGQIEDDLLTPEDGLTLLKYYNKLKKLIIKLKPITISYTNGYIRLITYNHGKRKFHVYRRSQSDGLSYVIGEYR